MSRSHFAILLTCLSLGACASAEYVCPKPIGKIIRDDCEVYRTRFETLKAELSASIGPVGAAIKVGKESLRDPSQLIQVLSHRTYALCRDFNACRVSPKEYRERRERADRIFTAVGAISSQLKAGLQAPQKAKLVAKLIHLLGEDRSPRHAGRVQGRPDVRRRAPPSGIRYSSWLPWYGTKRLPPQPAAKGPVMGHAKFSLGHVFRSGQGAVGYSLSGRFLVRGKLSADDLLTMSYGGKSVDCKIYPGSRSGNGMAAVSCRTPRKEPITAMSLAVTLRYAARGEGKPKPIGRATVRVMSRVSNPKNGSRNFGINHDERARNVQLIFRPVGGYLPPSYEQPSLLAVLKVRQFRRRRTYTARCWVDGKLATSAIAAYGRHSGHVGQFQDRDRYRRVAPGRSVSVKHPFVYWRRYDFPLPFYVEHKGGGSPPKDAKPWPRAGKWRCVISLDGDAVREVRFTVKSNGRLEPAPKHKQRPAAGWFLNTKVIATKHEANL
jgi:hypothetical protein